LSPIFFLLLKKKKNLKKAVILARHRKGDPVNHRQILGEAGDPDAEILGGQQTDYFQSQQTNNRRGKLQQIKK